MTQTVRVVPDIPGLAKAFDYIVPARWAGTVFVGTKVRINFSGRRVAGWVIKLDVTPPDGVALKEVLKISSLGPSLEVIDLAYWTAHRYGGSVTPILRSASPDKMTRSLPAGPTTNGLAKEYQAALSSTMVDLAESAVTSSGVTVVRVSPTDDLFAFVAAAAETGDSLVIVPSQTEARTLGAQVRSAGGRVALAGRDWGLGAAGGMVIGSRKATWATVRSLSCIVVLDEHDDSLQEERTPTWHAREVAIERAARLKVPCVLVSPSPSLMALSAADRVLSVDRSYERAGWPLVEVVDRRDGDPLRGGLFSAELAELLRTTKGRVLCILNRLGRAQMLACATCGELVRTNDGDHLMKETDGELVGPGGEKRPLICNRCSGTKLKRLRLGVSRAREELSALAQEDVGEVTSKQSVDDVADTRILIGTEALLHRVVQAEAVAFLDFDQEILAPRYRAAEMAMAQLTRAARLVGNRHQTPPGRLFIQTRSPEHRVVRSVLEANPSRLSSEELDLREVTGFPPFGALAEVSGSGADDYISSLRANAGLRAEVVLVNDAEPGIDSGLGVDAAPSANPAIEILGPRSDGRYLLKSDSALELEKVLATTLRPKKRVRVAVDPPRA